MKKYKFNKIIIKEDSYDKDFTTTGISNIDDMYAGLNFLQGGYSIGYIEIENFKEAQKVENVFKNIFKLLNGVKNRYNLNIKLEIQQK